MESRKHRRLAATVAAATLAAAAAWAAFVLVVARLTLD